MIYTTNIRKAIRFAIKTHDVYQKQKRKGKGVAYITHPLTVGLILARCGTSEDVVLAGILHDTIEDSPKHKRVTKSMLKKLFGAKVAALVDSVTEHRKSDPWVKRKGEALSHISTFSHGSVLVKSADTLANAGELLDDVARYGDTTFRHFNEKKEKIIANYLAVMGALLQRWPESPLAGDLRNLLKLVKHLS